MPTWKDDRLTLLETQARAKRENRMASFGPYPKQIQFFEMGAVKRERLLMAGNQVGKSEAAAFELACHLTGEYPNWWQGKRWDHPVRGWSAGESRDATRDILQRKLCGPPNNEELFGTGMIPKRLFAGKPMLSHGAAGAFDMFQVRHKSGGVSELTFKTYEQEVTKWQGPTLDFISFDEEPPKEHYNEGLARLTGDGMVFLTFTPLLGFSTVVSRFLRDDSPEARRDRGVVRMGLKDAEHFTEEEKARRLAGYPAHERAARAEGVPLLGSGAVFEEVIESDISTKLALSEVPAQWTKLWGVDFGIDHPFAAVLTAWDRDTDEIYVLHTIKMTGGVPVNHAAAMKAIGAAVPVAWPHDGTQRDKGSGEALS